MSLPSPLTRALALVGASALVTTTGLVSLAPAAQAAATPDPITAQVSRPYSGQRMLISWASTGGNTDHFMIKTGLTSFSGSGSGRNATTIRVPANARSYKLTTTDLARAGAAPGTGRQLYFKVYAVSATGHTSEFPYSRAMVPNGLPSKDAKDGTPMRIATFNVRTAKATWDKRHWMKRKGLVAAEIKASGADIVMIQELSPGRQDGRDGSTKKVGRQTTSLVNAMKGVGLGQYKLVRETQYKNPGEVHGTQGTRILYNTNKYELLSNCPEKNKKGKFYNPACSINLPIRKNDSGKAKRKAAYAAFEDRKTGKRFYVVSAHLDQRHSKSLAVERTLNALRGAQTRAILAKIDSINVHNRPVIFGGDLNSWQTAVTGDAPRDTLIANGFYDTANAADQVNIAYPSINHYKPVVERAYTGVGTRIDILTVRGIQGASLYWNKLKYTDTNRPSDHDLLAADIVL